jgi:SM-20-related protein
MAGITALATTDLSESTNHRIIEELLSQGWCVSKDYIDAQDCRELYLQAEKQYLSNDMQQAGIGRNDRFQVNRKIRSDYVKWLDPEQASGALQRYFNKLESLKTGLNRSLYLGLFDLECHMAIYPPGAFYAKHLDCFQGTSLRALTCILYLNQDWLPAHEGQLRIYTQPDNDTRYVEVFPHGGQLVTFLSARFVHEVLATRRIRASISGWFKRRSIQTV